MSPFLLELLPVLLFFIAFKYQGIYTATWVGIIATLLQSVLYRITQKRWDKIQLVTLTIFVLFGGMTLYFHNSMFIKWKPTILFWGFAIILWGSHFFAKKPMMQHILESAWSKQKNTRQQSLAISAEMGKKLNVAWILFFLVLGAVNIYVAYQFNDSTWVNFKLYGITLATVLFSVFQTVFLMKSYDKK